MLDNKVGQRAHRFKTGIFRQARALEPFIVVNGPFFRVRFR